MNLARQRALFIAALAATHVAWRDPEPPVVAALKRWLDCWRGVGVIAAGMCRHGYDLHLSCDQEGWRATFLLRTPQRPLPGQIIGEPATPWHAVQGAAWYALQQVEPAPDLTQEDVSPR